MSSPRRPNLLVLFTDDQRFDTIAALNNPRIHTPNVDALAARGTAMTRAYIMGGAVGAVCMPSRAMLHTGRTVFHTERQGAVIPDDHVLLGEHLRRAGYRTFGTGKWHNAPAAYARSFTDGAEIFFGGMNDHWNVPACEFDPTGRYPDARRLHTRWGDRIVKHETIYDHVATGRHSSTLFADATIDWLRGRDADDPFFAYVAFMAPHDPREMPPQFLTMYDPDEIELPPNFLPEHPFDNGELRVRDEQLAGFPRTEAEVRKHIAEYYAMISHLDAEIGRILEALDETGRGDETIVVFAGDNGLAVGRHGLMGKQNVYEHSVHVPLILAGPGVAQGQRSDAMVLLTDLFATLCELMGLDTPPTVEGRSFAGCLSDPRAPHRDELHLLYGYVQRACRDERWKLIEYVVDGRRTTQLFDLASDPHELDNRADDDACREHRRRLSVSLRKWRDELDDPADEFWEKIPAEE